MPARRVPDGTVCVECPHDTRRDGAWRLDPNFLGRGGWTRAGDEWLCPCCTAVERAQADEHERYLRSWRH